LFFIAKRKRASVPSRHGDDRVHRDVDADLFGLGTDLFGRIRVTRDLNLRIGRKSQLHGGGQRASTDGHSKASSQPIAGIQIAQGPLVGLGNAEGGGGGITYGEEKEKKDKRKVIHR
jgi:hypothetical protein